MSSLTKVYVSALYCSKCDIYTRPTCRGGMLIDPCPECGGERKVKNVIKGSEQDPRIQSVFTNITFKENVRVSHSMGVPIAQFEQARQAHPGIEWKKVGTSMCPVIRNRPGKLRIMKSFGMEEYPPNLFGQINEKSKWENRRRR